MRCLEAFVPRQIAFAAHCRDGNAKSRSDNYSITWSARASNDSGILRPSALAAAPYHIVERELLCATANWGRRLPPWVKSGHALAFKRCPLCPN
jgi:hypothetical protein